MQVFTLLNEYRTKLNLSLNQLSKLSKVSKAHLSDIENGKVNPTIEIVCKIAHALNVTLNDLVKYYK